MGQITGRDMANSWLLFPLLKILIVLIYIVSHVYDYVTYPVWYLAQKPWRTKRVQRSIHSKGEEPENGEVVYHSIVEPTAVNRDLRRYNLNTLEKVWSHVVGKFNDRQALGTRDIIAETQEVLISRVSHIECNDRFNQMESCTPSISWATTNGKHLDSGETDLKSSAAGCER